MSAASVVSKDIGVDTCDLLRTFAELQRNEALKERDLEEGQAEKGSNMIQVEQPGASGFEAAVHWADPLIYHSDKRKVSLDIEQKIEQFIKRRREMINASNNAEFIDQSGGSAFSARTSAATVNRKLQMRQSVAYNQDGPLLNTMKSYWEAESGSASAGKSLDSPGVAARLEQIESHLNVNYAPSAIPVTVYDRLKLLESKITLLETTLPAWAEQHFSSLDEQRCKEWKSKLLSFAPAPELVEQVKELPQWPEPPKTIFRKLTNVRFSESTVPSTSNGQANDDGESKDIAAKIIYVPKKDRAANISGAATPQPNNEREALEVSDSQLKDELMLQVEDELKRLKQEVLQKYAT